MWRSWVKMGRIYFWKGDFRDLLFRLRKNPRHIQDTYGLEFERFRMYFILQPLWVEG